MINNVKEKLQPLSSNFKILSRFIKLCHKYSKSYIVLAVLQAFFKAAIIIPNIIFPKYIIDALIKGNGVEYIFKLALAYIICSAAIKVLNHTINYFKNLNIEKLLYSFENDINNTVVTMKFEHVEDPNVLNMKESALHAINNEQVFEKVIDTLSILLVDIINMIMFIIIVAAFNILILIPVVFIVLLNSKNFYKLEKLKYESNQNAIPINRGYIYNIVLTMDFFFFIDIRVNACSDLVLSKMKEYNKQVYEIFSTMYKNEGHYNGINKINIQIQMACVYLYIAYKALRRKISVGDFTMYTVAINEFGNTLINFITTAIEISQLCNYLKMYYKFNDIAENERYVNKKSIEKGDFKIEFKNISFKYPRIE